MKNTLLLFAILIVTNIQAQIKQAELITKQVRQYEKTEWNIQLTEQWQNPYLQGDVALNMKLKSPSGKTLIVPCYYVSGESGKLSNWKARFAPQELGKYECSFELTKNGKKVNELKSSTFKSEKSNKKGFLHANDNFTFKFDNGEIFRGIGENICWEARSNDDSKFFKQLHEDPRFNYDFMLKKLTENGGNYTRIWMCYWNFPLEWKTVSPDTKRYTNSTEYYNPSAIAKLDRLFELSDSLGIYIMLTISGNNGFKESNYHIKNGGFVETDSAFFVHPKSKEQYKDKLRYLIARWGYSPSIGAWEFFNEVDYLSFSKNPNDNSRQKAVTAWHDEMSTFLKQNDPYNHLVTTSISHREVDGLNSVKNIDFNQRHIYKYTNGIPKVINENIEKFQKPYVIGEFGYEWDWSKNFNEFSDGMDSDFKRGLWYGLFSSTPILPMSWWWEFFENRGLMSYFKRVREISDKMLKAGNGKFETLNISTKESDLQIYGLKCGKTIFVYVFNSSKEKKQVSFEIPFNEKPSDVQSYLCETGTYSLVNQISTQNGTLTLSNLEFSAQTDKVFIIK